MKSSIRIGPYLAAVGVALFLMRYAVAAQADEPIKPIPTMPKQDPARVELGRLLFSEPRLSVTNTVSCASCHDLAQGGVDRRPHSLGIHGRSAHVNTPTVFNAALNFKQFWNGRADTLEAQIDAVVQNASEMGSKWPDVVAKITRDFQYRHAFAHAYDDGVTKANIQNALASYERTLVTPNSRFDRYLRGEAAAINAEEKAGYAKFKQYGCVSCHQGVNIGGNMFQKLGVMKDYFAAHGTHSNADLGRYLVTHDENDKYVFKVPSLRNVALTAPYFHDASAKTLDDAVDVMLTYQVGRTASRSDKQAIVKFLHTLTGVAAAR